MIQDGILTQSFHRFNMPQLKTSVLEGDVGLAI
jgi:hypothetical protein